MTSSELWTAIASTPGLIALAIQLYDKFTAKPKLKLRIRRTDIDLIVDKRNFLYFRGSAFLEISNVGKEITTISEIQFRTDMGHKYQVNTHTGLPVGPQEFGTLVVRRNEGHFLQVSIWTGEDKNVDKVRGIHLWIKEITGREHLLHLPIEGLLKSMSMIENSREN